MLYYAKPSDLIALKYGSARLPPIRYFQMAMDTVQRIRNRLTLLLSLLLLAGAFGILNSGTFTMTVN